MITADQALDEIRDALLAEFTSPACPLDKRDEALGRIIAAIENSGRDLIGSVDYLPRAANDQEEDDGRSEERG